MIKDTAANIGGMAPSAQALRVEQIGKTGAPETTEQEVIVLEQFFGQLKLVIKDHYF